MLAIQPQHNSTHSSARRAFDLVSECSNISPIRRSPAGCHNERSVDSGGEQKKCWPLVNAENDNDQDADEIPIWICGEPRYISGITTTTTCREIIQALIDDELRNDGDGASTTTSESTADGRRPKKPLAKEFCRQPTKRQPNARDFAAASRDLSDYVITERWRDVEQALDNDTHILPIWLAWGSTRSEIRFKLKINKSKDGGGGLRYEQDGRGSSSSVVVGDDAEHLFVPTRHQHKRDKAAKKKHKFKALAKMMKRLVLQSESIQQRLSQLTHHEYEIAKPAMISAPPVPPIQPTSFEPGKALLLRNYLHDSATVSRRRERRPIDKCEPRALDNIYVRLGADDDFDTMAPIDIRTATATDDELFLLIEDEGGATNRRRSSAADDASDDLDSGVHVEYRQYVLNKKLQTVAAASTGAVRGDTEHRLTDRLIQLSETPKRKYRTKCDFDRLRARSLSRRRAESTKPPPMATKRPEHHVQAPQRHNHASNIRMELAARLLDLDRLLQYERQLLAALAQRSAQFRAQNEQYTVRHSVAVVATDFQRIQCRLDAYAKDIVDIECRLYGVQLDITQKCGILHNLQRMAANGVDGEDDATDTDGTGSTDGTAMTDAVAERIASEKGRHLEEIALLRAAESQEEFVDNVNEFCDINQSIIV